jgi:hypothetical protein
MHPQRQRADIDREREHGHGEHEHKQPVAENPFATLGELSPDVIVN